MLSSVIAAIFATGFLSHSDSFTYICLDCGTDLLLHDGCGNCYNNLTCTTTMPYNVTLARYKYRECDAHTFFCQDNIKCSSTCVDNMCKYKCTQCNVIPAKEYQAHEYDTFMYTSLFTIFFMLCLPVYTSGRACMVFSITWSILIIFVIALV